MAFTPPPMVLASSDAMRPVFMIIMGLALLLVAWRLTRRASGWPSRILMAGAILLAIGYALVLPLYSARVVIPLELLMLHPDVDPGVSLGWHVIKLVAMNGGWLLFGLGLALHARVFEIPARVSSPQAEEILP